MDLFAESLDRTAQGADALARALTQPAFSVAPAVVGAGLAAAAAGQLAKYRAPSAWGIMAVTSGYVAYAWQLRGAHNDALGWSLRAGAWLAGVALAPTPRHRAASAVAGAAAVTVSALAGDPALRADVTKGASHGANLLLASEALTVLRARGARGGSLLNAAETATWVVGHLLLNDALHRR